jgi:hypothetical protein
LNTVGAGPLAAAFTVFKFGGRGATAGGRDWSRCGHAHGVASDGNRRRDIIYFMR